MKRYEQVAAMILAGVAPNDIRHKLKITADNFYAAKLYAELRGLLPMTAKREQRYIEKLTADRGVTVAEIDPWPEGIRFEDSMRAIKAEPVKWYARGEVKTWSSLSHV